MVKIKKVLQLKELEVQFIKVNTSDNIDQGRLTERESTEAGLLNKSLCLAPTLGVNKFIIVKDMILVTLCCAT